ncbi:MAG: MBOAT family O-acyltransferase [Bacteroidales bacterium]
MTRLANILDNLIALFIYDPKDPMLFSSGFFFFLFFAFYVVYNIMRDMPRKRIIYVAAFSLYFYYKSSGIFFILLLITATSDFFVGRWIASSSKNWQRKAGVIWSLILNHGLLAYFKYTNLLLEIVADITESNFSPLSIILPVGISFFTFQSLSYTIDIYRRELEPLKRWSEYIFYLSFFPQLVAGPIVRASEFLPQINRTPLLTKAMFGEAIFLICSGLLKKALISDYISINFVDRVFDAPQLYTGIENLLALYGYALQIYCDFSGYSDMAIGIALLLGFRFNINFNSPYKSATITEFWRRWHISLSGWLRDYLYISMGGSRKGKIRTYINLLITMLLGGLWHGASLRFLFWGALHGTTLAIHKALMSLFPSLKSSGDKMNPLHRVVGTVITFHIVCLGWIFFRADTAESGVTMLKQITNHFHPEIALKLIEGYPKVIAIMAIGYLLHLAPQKWEVEIKNISSNLPLYGKFAVIASVIWIIMQLKTGEVQPFIYFQF